jgi:lipopolysaccharide export system protein LptC
MRGSALRAQHSEDGAQQAAVLEATGGWGLAAWTGTALDDRHSRRVALLKRLLPAIGVALLLLIAMWPRLAPLWERIRLSFPAIDLRDARELQMVNPRYAGVDREGRPFIVTASSGRQIPDRQDLMSLQAPRADLRTHGGADIAVTAISGVYQAQAQLLDLFGDVTVLHQNGSRFVTQTARLNAATNTAQGSDPVEGHGPSGDLKAQGFRILDQGDVVLFTGKSEMVLKGAKPATAKNAPAALPRPVAVAAARAEAEAKPLLAAARAAPAGRNAAAPAGKAPARTKPTAAKPAAKKSP